MKRIIFLLLLNVTTLVFAQQTPTVTLTSPTSTSFNVGQVMTISWNSTNQHHHGIFLWKGNTEIASINLTNGNNDNNARSFQWTIPASVIDIDDNGVTHVLDGNDYRIKMVVWNSDDEATAQTAHEFTSYLSITPQTSNSAPNHVSTYSNPTTGSSGDNFTFITKWTEPDDDTINAVEMRYRKETSSTWTYIPGNEISFVSGSNPLEYRITKAITGASGDYKLQARAKDENGLWANFSQSATFTIQQQQNQAPNVPTFISAPSSSNNLTNTISVKSGADPENDKIRLVFWATDSNYTQSVPYKSSFAYGTNTFNLSVTFSSYGNKTIYAYTEDENGNKSTTINQPISLTQSGGQNVAPNQPVFTSVPSNFTVNQEKTITVTSGNDNDNDQVKIKVWADNSSLSTPYISSLGTGGQQYQINVTFTQEGAQIIYAQTIDANGNESTIKTTSVNVTQDNTTSNEVMLGNINFTASSIVEISSNIFKLSGDVTANNVLQFTGDVTIDKNDLKVSGTGKVYLTNIPHISGDVELYDGSFEYNVPNTSSELIGIAIDKANEKFKMSNLPIHINSMTMLSDGISISGKITFPELLNSSEVNIDNLQITKSTGVNLVADLHIPEIKGVGFTLKEMTFNFNSIDDKFNASGSIKTDLFTASAAVEIIPAGINRIGMEIKVSNPQPLGTTGLSISGLNGDISNIQTHPDPPLTITIGASLTPVGTSPDILEFSQVSLTYKFGTSLEGSGTFKVLGKSAANAGFTIQEGLFKVKAEINFYDIVNAAITAGIAKNQNNSVDVFARFEAAVTIPEIETGFPFQWIGSGLNRALNLPLEIAEFDNILFNNQLTGKGQLAEKYKFSYSLTYENGSVDKKFATNYSRFTEYVFPGGNARKNNQVPLQFQNITLSKSNKNYNRFEGKSLIINPVRYKNQKDTQNRTTQDFVLSKETETIVVRLKPENSGVTPEYTITLPSGEEVSASNHTNFENIEYSENTDKKGAYYTFKDAPPGAYVLNISTTSQSNAADVFGTKGTQGIVINNVEKNGNQVKVSWNAYNPDFDGQISLYYDYDNEGLDGTLIISGINEDDGNDSYTFDVSNLQAGSYYVYAVMFNQDGEPVASYSANPFTITSDINAVNNFTHTVNGNNTVTFTWDKIEDGYDYDYLLYYQTNEPVTLSSLNVNAGNRNNYTFTDFNIEKPYEFMIVAKRSDNKLSNPTVAIAVDLAQKQTHTFNAGWNLIGFNLTPFNTAVAEVFSPISNQLLQVKTETQTYDPNLADYLNTLQNTQNGKGYWVKLSEATTLENRGTKIDLSSFSIALQQGWNLISFPAQQATDISTALQSIESNIIQVKSSTKTYDPNLPSYLNTLTQLEPNKGYWIKVNQNCTLTF